MGTNKDKILEKLRKLMNLKESAKELGNYGEANAAAAGITRLLIEYNLSESDIPEQEKINNPIVSEEIPFKAEMSDGPWYFNLVDVICNYNMCSCLQVSVSRNGRMKRDRMEIVGRKNNVEVVLYLISFLSHQFVSHGKHSYPQYKHDCIRKYGTYPKSITMYMKSFLYGCVCGLVENFEEDKNTYENKTDIKALVCTAKSEIDEFLKGKKIGTCSPSKPAIDILCAKKGVEVGRNIEVCKGIHAKVVSEDLMLK